MFFFFFFFNDTATTEIYTLSLHDALPIYVLDIRSAGKYAGFDWDAEAMGQVGQVETGIFADRKSTRLNSSHVSISYAVFCLKKKKKKKRKIEYNKKYVYK